MSSIKDVNALHQKFGFPILDEPGFLNEDFMNMRIDFLQEELNEFKEAYLAQNLEAALDALIDLTYVTLGTADLMGFGGPVPINDMKSKWASIWWEAWSRVHKANMAKEKGKTSRGHEIDLVKPKGWIKPQFKDLLP